MPRHDPIPPRRPSPPDPDRAAEAWVHFRRSMRWTTMAALAMVALSLFWLWQSGPVQIHMLIATALGVGLSVIVAGALMGLIYFSSRSGADDDVGQGDEDDDHRHG